jgi:hypothetical protein
MSDCCSSPRPAVHPRQHRCPANGKAYSEVSARTIAHHIRKAWEWQAGECRYFYCDDPDCEVVYFGEDGSVLPKSELRTRIGAKEEASDEALVCYCFGVTRADALHDAGARDYVLGQTKQRNCSCETSNPSGRCCLKDFPGIKNGG